VVDLPVPDRAERRAILAVHTGDKPLASDVDLETLADLTDGLVGGDIASICRRATMLAVREHVEQEAGGKKALQLSARHFRQALAAVVKASQFTRGHRLLQEGPSAERPPAEQRQTASEGKPQPQRTSPLA
jgi:transitional endoplasmic reticulum ATPase